MQSPVATDSRLHRVQAQILRPSIEDAEQLNTGAQVASGSCDGASKRENTSFVRRGSFNGIATMMDTSGDCPLRCISYPPAVTNSQHVSSPPTSAYVYTFLFNVVPRQIYLHVLLRLPALYFHRVARVFEESELSMQEIEEMGDLDTDLRGDGHSNSGWSRVPPRYARLKARWEQLVQSLMREWRTMSIVSAFLMSIILATLQISKVYNDPISQNIGLLALVCAAMSLLYGCVYIFQFNVMRRARKAVEWAREAQKTRTPIFWNAWVFLAMPSVWFSWSVIFYLASLLALAWRILVNSDDDDVKLRLFSVTQILRIGLCSWGLYFVGRFCRFGAAGLRRRSVQRTGSAQS